MKLSADDRLAILDLYGRYCHAVDSFDGDAWASCFTSDGEFMPSTGRDRGKEIRGRGALARHGSDRGREQPCRHWTSNIVLAVHADHVAGACYGMRVSTTADPPAVVSSVVYHDRIEQREGEWLFRSRRPVSDLPVNGLTYDRQE